MKVIRFCMSLPRNLQNIPSKAGRHSSRQKTGLRTLLSEEPCNMLLDGDANLATSGQGATPVHPSLLGK